MYTQVRNDVYEEMLERLAWLDALEEAGVDNWEGISFAHEIFEENKGEQS